MLQFRHGNRCCTSDGNAGNDIRTAKRGLHGHLRRLIAVKLSGVAETDGLRSMAERTPLHAPLPAFRTSIQKQWSLFHQSIEFAVPQFGWRSA
jgi:hypothetical protein